MNRMDALREIVDRTAALPVVAVCAATSRELAALQDRPNHLYLLDAMGLTSSVGIGLAIALEDSPIERVVVIDGDGSLFMNLGSLATMGYLRPTKLILIVLDNAVYASTANIPTYSDRVDLGAVAASCGIGVGVADTPAALGSALDEALAVDGPGMLHVRIEPGNTAGTPLLLMDPVVMGARFQDWLKGMEAA
jgi:sulfopyruvate decarboxylase subunit beta